VWWGFFSCPSVVDCDTYITNTSFLNFATLCGDGVFQGEKYVGEVDAT
jgi:hypothetical protein